MCINKLTLLSSEPGVYRKTETVSTDSVGADSGLIARLYPETVNYIRLVADNGAAQVASEEFALSAGPARPGLLLIVK